MLKRIKLSDVELGMFVHQLEGSWLDHPFWKKKFLLQDSKVLARLQASAIPGVIIDTDKGYDVRPISQSQSLSSQAPASTPAPVLRERARPQRRHAPAVDTAAELRSTAPRSLTREFGLAARVAGTSRKVVSRIFLESRFGKTIKASLVEPVIEDIFASIQRNPHAFNGLMRCKRDNAYVYRHALAVSALMISLARQMRLPAEQVRLAGKAGLLMDVGIGHLPVDLTSYGGDYRNLDPAILEQHVKLGHEFLQAGGNIDDPVLDVCLSHHEQLDGGGYPHGLKAEGISVLARMAAICDTYDSLVSDTAEGTGMDPASAVAQMACLTGWFDPDIMQRFVETMGIYPIGSVVRLRSGRLGMVIAQSASDHAHPRVRAFFSIAERKFIKACDIDLSQCFGEDEIEGTADPETYDIVDFPALRERLFTAGAKAAN